MKLKEGDRVKYIGGSASYTFQRRVGRTGTIVNISPIQTFGTLAAVRFDGDTDYVRVYADNLKLLNEHRAW